MKTRNLLSVLALTLTSMMLSSCLDNDGDDWSKHYANAIVTVKPDAESHNFIIWVSEDFVGRATNMPKNPYGDKEVRALANIELEKEVKGGLKDIHVNWMDSIRTKSTVDMGELKNLELKSDPVEVINDFTTVAEDGYLTLRLRTIFGYIGVRHNVNLLTNMDGENPYTMTLIHDAQGDLSGEYADSHIAFRLKDVDRKAQAEGKDEVEITLKWKSFFGDKEAKFNYKVRKD